MPQFGDAESHSGGRLRQERRVDRNVLAAIRDRRATRAYTPRQVDVEEVRALLDAAVQAPSARNLQPWSFAVIQDRLLLREISEQAKRQLAHDSHWKQMLPLGDPGFDIFYGAGTLIVICSQVEGFCPVGDCYMAGQNLMLAACGMGLATCPIGLARDVLQAEPMRKKLHIPAGEQPVLPIVVGYAEGVTTATQRAAPRIRAWLKQEGRAFQRLSAASSLRSGSVFTTSSGSSQPRRAWSTP